MGDVLLTIAVAFTQITLGYMGVHMSLKPPRREKLRWWITAFIIVGLSGLVLTGWLAERAGDSQDKAFSEITKAQIAATSANAAATNANNAAVDAQKEAKAARGELQNAQEQLGNLINKNSIETNTVIGKWQSDTESAVGKLLLPDRAITADQSQIIIKILKTTMPTEITIRHTPGCYECQQYADQLAETIKGGGWIIQMIPPPIIQLTEFHGLMIVVRSAGINKVTVFSPTANKLIEALQAAGIKVKIGVSEAINEGQLEIRVGLP